MEAVFKSAVLLLAVALTGLAQRPCHRHVGRLVPVEMDRPRPAELRLVADEHTVFVLDGRRVSPDEFNRKVKFVTELEYRTGGLLIRMAGRSR